jgi:type VI secretion system protein ImpH
VSFLELLERAPHAFDFHVALRRLEGVFRSAPRFGQAVHAAEEPVRLGQDPSLAFAPSSLQAFQAPRDGLPGRLQVAFFGLFGPQGPLPLHLTEYARERLRNAGDGALASFVDLFHHRMLSLFHRAWARSQPTASQDRPADNHFATYLGSLCGIGMRSLRGRDTIADSSKLYYAALLAGPTRNAESLRALLSDFFETPVAIEEFVCDWVTLPRDSRFALGRSQETSALGRTTVLGARVQLCQHKFRIVLGPLSGAQFARLLPGSEALARLVALVRLYAGDEWQWDVRLVLAPEDSAQLQLSRGARLGWNTRLGAAGAGDRAEDLIVDPLLEQTRRSTPALRH